MGMFRTHFKWILNAPSANPEGPPFDELALGAREAAARKRAKCPVLRELMSGQGRQKWNRIKL